MKKAFLTISFFIAIITSYGQYVPWGAYVSSNGPHGQNFLRYQLVDNVLYSATSRFLVTSSEPSYNASLPYLFNGKYDQVAVNVLGSLGPSTFTIDFTAKGTPTIDYAHGYIYLHFYSSYVPQSVTGRAMDRNGVWSTITDWSNVATNTSAYAVWRGFIPIGNYMNKMEITITPPSGGSAAFAQWEFVMDRADQYEKGVITKFGDQSFYNTLSWKDVNNTVTAKVDNAGNAQFNKVTIPNGELYLYGTYFSGIKSNCLSQHYFNACGTAGYLTFGFTTNTGAQTTTPDPLTIQQTNLSVGINNNNPQAKLHVQGAGATSGTSPFLVQNGSTYDVFRVNDDASVKIGSSGRTGRLDVNGQVTSTKVKVTATAWPWPDYVFHRHYQLPSLEYVEDYIKKHRHLPDIPSAKQVADVGIDIGDNQALLLKKIEELTLYIIEQNKKISSLEQRVKQIEKK